MGEMILNESLNIPFSVYTAWEGYDWSSVPEGISREELDTLYRTIGEHRPDFMGPGDSFEGVYYFKGLLAAFRMQSVPKWDSVGRDADYCAFAFMGYDVVQDFDFDVLLSLPAFSEATRTPGDYVLYSGSRSATYSIPAAMELFEERRSTRVDFRSIGDLLAKCGDFCDDWLFVRTHFHGEEKVFARTGEWTGSPADWEWERARKKASLHKFSLEDIEMILGGQK